MPENYRALAFVHRCVCERLDWCHVAVHPFGRWQLKLCSLPSACAQEQQDAVTTGDHESSFLMSAVSLPGTLECPGFVSADDFRLFETPVVNGVASLNYKT